MRRFFHRLWPTADPSSRRSTPDSTRPSRSRICNALSNGSAPRYSGQPCHRSAPGAGLGFSGRPCGRSPWGSHPVRYRYRRDARSASRTRPLAAWSGFATLGWSEPEHPGRTRDWPRSQSRAAGSVSQRRPRGSDGLARERTVKRRVGLDAVRRAVGQGSRDGRGTRSDHPNQSPWGFARRPWHPPQIRQRSRWRQMVLRE